MASNTEKFDTFVATPMGDKDVTAIPGIGKAFGAGLRAKNIKKSMILSLLKKYIW